VSLLSALREHVLLKAEDRPGVYRMLDANGGVLHVMGKSVRVRARVLSYFNVPEGRRPSCSCARRAVEWEYVPNEFEALLRRCG
jgi:excinuclease UvrABC nuclease subunit